MSLVNGLTAGRLSRRQMLKNSGIFSATAMLAPIAMDAQSGGVVEPQTVTTLTAKGTPTDNLYTQIGVRPIINARGTFTIITGSQSLPEVKQAMFEASRYYVHLDELMPAVGSEIAKLMGAPSAIVTCGCEAAIALATVACMCGTDPEESQAFPYIRKKDQVIIPKYSRNPYDFGTRMSGPEIVEVESDDELRSKLSERTAMIYLYSGPRMFQEPLSVKTVCAIAKEKGVPVFVDAAAEEPVVPNIHLAAGATFVGYSGGKCMRGPQTAGVLLGPKDLVAAAFWNAAPHHNWGRALKVGKEEAMGMLAAVRMWYKRDHDAEQKQWLQWDQAIADAVKSIPTVTTEIKMPSEDLSNRAPTLRIKWDGSKVGITGTELVEKLDKGTPRILVDGGSGMRPDHMESSVGIMPYMLQPGEYKVVAETIAHYLKNPGEVPKVPVYGGPAAKLDGRWNVEVHYNLGVGHQVFTLQQQGDKITGEQKGEIYTTKIAGEVKGDHAFLNSVMKANGQDVRFSFSGAVSGNTFSGDVNLGEYGKATFTATRA
ncbi:Cys/Met metabolism pyridoxal-phosphate-dependent protein [Terriglobus aquaticus]|uniref:Cys/Met metabolism pyridoxal-phosphate-dependent protein n=1 Tax=Terriglobus aquaticus TaxID=940139 RepID=A0ABW9KJK4_9BACT|nr:Cys/Met metabolism pyridoxal-phosphate-dependent protein [Terriglobus aquaticus]